MLKRWTPLVVFLLSLVFWQVGLTRWLNHVDEGLADVAATRVLAGELPYRDFWTYYAPGQYYLLAAAFRLGGVSVLTSRVLGLLTLAGLMLLLYLIARELAGPGWAGLAWLLALGWKFGPPLALSLNTALLLEMGSVLCFLLFLRRGRRWLLAAGALAGLTALFRQDLGLYTALAEAVTLAVYLRVRRLPAKTLGALLLPALAVVLPVAAFFLVRVPWSVLVYDFYTFPLHVFPVVRHAPYPTPFTGPHALTSAWLWLDPGEVWLKLCYLWPFYLPGLVYLAALVWLLRPPRRLRWTAEPALLCGGLLLLLLGGLQFTYTRASANLWHVWPFALPATVLLPLLLARAWPRREGGLVRRGSAVVLAALVVVTGAALAGPQLIRWAGYAWSEGQVAPESEFILPRAAGMIMEPEERGYQAALAWVLAYVPPDQTIYVGHYRHDRLDNNDILFYFLAQRPPATRYEELHPGVATTPAVQREIIADLEAHRTRYVILDQGGEDRGPDPASAAEAPLDAYLSTRFTPVCRYDLTPPGLFAAYTILVRKPGS